jgi:hypothetical protein
LSDPKIIYSTLSRTVREGDTEVLIDIYRMETTDWSLEVVDQAGGSTVWTDLFRTEQAALDEAMKTIREEGIRTFLTSDKPVLHYYRYPRGRQPSSRIRFASRRQAPASRLCCGTFGMSKTT